MIDRHFLPFNNSFFLSYFNSYNMQYKKLKLTTSNTWPVKFYKVFILQIKKGILKLFLANYIFFKQNITDLTQVFF